MTGAGRRTRWVVGAFVLGLSGCASGKPPAAVKVVEMTVGDVPLENRSLGFSVTSPAGWEKVEHLGKDGGGTIAFVAPPRPTDAPEGAPRGTIGVTVQPLAPADAATPAAFVQWYLKGFKKQWPTVTVMSQSSTVVRGRPAVELMLTNPATDPHGQPFTVKILGVFLVKGRRGYLLYYNHEASRFQDHLAARQRILDSLSLNDHPQKRR